MAITRSDELRHSSAARDTKLSSRVIAIIICSLNNVLLNGFIVDWNNLISHLINVENKKKNCYWSKALSVLGKLVLNNFRYFSIFKK
jgi:hypothetical protein